MAPEISSLLGLISGVALIFVVLRSLISDRGDSDRKKRISLSGLDSQATKCLILLLLLTVSLCALPSLQRPSAIASANQSMANIFSQSKSVDAPFRWRTFFGAAEDKEVRYDALERSGNRAVWIEIPWAEHAFDKVFSGLSNQMALPFIEQFLAQTLKT